MPTEHSIDAKALRSIFVPLVTCWNIRPSVFPTRRRFSLRGALR